MSKLNLIALGLAGFSALSAQPRFDMQVRNNFFMGFGGDAAALDRGMKACEHVLAQNPKHAEALVWHGGGLFFTSGQLFRKGDANKGRHFMGGASEMDDAVTLEPASVGVLIPHGATLLTASRGIPPGDQASRPLMQGLMDYKKACELQSSYFDTQARGYFEKLAAAGPGCGHYAEAKAWLETGKLDPKRVACMGCHVRS